MSSNGQIPVLLISAETLPEAWEKLILALWESGSRVHTEYDRRDAHGAFEDEPSRDATVLVEVKTPLAEPRIHKNIPAGLEELEVYRQEVLYGIHDHWIDPSDPDKWTYTYHQRLYKYQAVARLDDPGAPRLAPVNQMDYVIEKLCEHHYTRRAQAVTWIPGADAATEDPPCLQRLWFRILADERDEWHLNMNSHWRSRDAYKAWFMNAFALTDLQRTVAEAVSRRMKRVVHVGRYADVSDSLHIYGSYFRQAEPEVAKMKADPDYRHRAWNSTDPAVVEIFEETRTKLRANPDYVRGARS